MTCGGDSRDVGELAEGGFTPQSTPEGVRGESPKGRSRNWTVELIGGRQTEERTQMLQRKD